MKCGKQTKRIYVHPCLLPLPLEYEGALMECSVRTDANNVNVEKYHDYFFDNGMVNNEGDPFAISFGEE